MNKRFSFLVLVFVFTALSGFAQRWSVERANRWYKQYPWLIGTNFNPSTAINQLEMWQAESFDLETIKRELKWSAEMGFNMHRVYLHNLVWEVDSTGLIERMDLYLEAADELGIKTMFVLLDDVWDPNPKLGKQPDPIPHVHNSGWVQAPGRAYLEDESKHDLIEQYVKGILRAYQDDQRVLAWDLYNEPGNTNGNSYGPNSKNKTGLDQKTKDKLSLRLLNKVAQWAREVDPSQPLTFGIWRGDFSKWGSLDQLPPLDRALIENSDIITFHAYDHNLRILNTKIDGLKVYGRPMICTEYMARTNNNTFDWMMPLLKENNIGGVSWGFVAGKSNTIYPWQSWDRKFEAEPEVWFHDILRPDGTPFDPKEVAFIKSMTK